MSRPPLEIGTFGTISLMEVSPGRWRARAKVRDHDGVTRRVERFGTSRSGAERRLKVAIRDRLHMSGDEDITPDTTLGSLAQTWLGTVGREGKLSPQTLEKYSRTIANHIDRGVGGLRIREATVGKLDRFIGAIESDSTARWCRVILTGMLGLAARRDAIPSNPMRDTERRSAPAPVVRAMTLDEVHTLRSNVAAWAGSNRMGPPRGDDLAELLDVILGTGVRIGEALALRWKDIDLDDQVPTALVAGTLVTVGGKVLRQDHPKTATGRRVVVLPSFVVDALQRQRARDLPAEDGLVFPSARGSVRSPNNARRQLRDARGEELAWVTPHILRKTTATTIDRAVGIDAAAAQLGHSGTRVTATHYIHKAHAAPDLRTTLDGLAPVSGGLRGADGPQSDIA